MKHRRVSCAYQTDEEEATVLRPYDDDQVIISFSVWTGPDALLAYACQVEHSGCHRRDRVV